MPRLPDIPQFPELGSPEERRAFEHKAAEEAMESEHQAFAGRARHVGGVEFDDPGVFEIDEGLEEPDVLGAVADVGGPPIETGYGSAAPSDQAETDSDLGGAPAPNVVAPQQGTAEMTARKDDREPDRPSLRREWKGDSTDEGRDELYNPSEIGATRMRMQGLGMGEEELRMQRDPGGERHTRSETPGGEPEAKPSGRPDKRQ